MPLHFYPNGMEFITLNLSTSASRRVKLHGRDYLVVPLTMLVSGVLNGSKGPLYYPPEELARDPDAWNGMPIVVYHPMDESTNKPISARTPEVAGKSEIGRVYNARYVEDKALLAGEGWIDLEVCKNVNLQVYNALINNQRMELSTGLGTHDEPAVANAQHKGKPYKATARYYRPDHLAFLPGQRGACALEHGCGVNVYNHANPTEQTLMNRDAIITELTTNCDCWKGEDGKAALNGMSDERLTKIKAGYDRSKKALAVQNTAEKGFTHGGISFVFNSEKNEFQASEPVKSATAPAPTPSTPSTTPSTPSAPPPTPTPSSPPAPTTPTTTNGTKPMTAEEWYANAPEEVRQTLNYGKEAHQRDKNTLIAKLTANKSDADKAVLTPFLQGKSIPELNTMLLLSGPAATPAAPAAAYLPAGPVFNTAKDLTVNEDDVLSLPRMDYSDVTFQGLKRAN